jgi:purine-binding chemotaxis protein CheW
MNQLAVADNLNDLAAHTETITDQYVTFRVDGQLFGVNVLGVQDILRTEEIAFVPMAPPEVRGSINLRGRIVTVIDVRVRLGLPAREEGENTMGVTVEQSTELYTLSVDEIGEVLSLPVAEREDVPGTLGDKWRNFAEYIYKLDGELMIVLDIDKLLRH